MTAKQKQLPFRVKWRDHDLVKWDQDFETEEAAEIYIEEVLRKKLKITVASRMWR